MVKKFVACQPAVDDHKLSVNSISKKSYGDSKVKVLKPKVYILSDSSTFKSLVQELTGNGNIRCTSVCDTSASLSSSCATTFEPIDHEEAPIVQNNMMYTSTEDYGFQEMSPDLSFHSSDHHIRPISVPVIPDFPPCAIVSIPTDDDQDPVIGNDMMYTIGDYGFQESSPELSLASSDHRSDLISAPVTWDFSQEISGYMPSSLKDDEFQSTWDMMSYPLQSEDMESWFCEIDSSVYNNYGSNWLQPVMSEEVCAFACDLSAIM